MKNFKLYRLFDINANNRHDDWNMDKHTNYRNRKRCEEVDAKLIEYKHTITWVVVWQMITVVNTRAKKKEKKKNKLMRVNS